MKEKNEVIEKGINFASNEFKMKLVEDINNTDLPITIISSILNDLSIQIENLAIQQIQKEKLEYEEKVNKIKKGEDK